MQEILINGPSLNKSMIEALLICAHPDDEIFGAGATIAKYQQEGKKVITVICSAGETSHPWLQYQYLVNLRRGESQRASAIVKTEQLLFLNLRDGKLAQDLQKTKVQKKLQELVAKEKPRRILTHARDDPHPDHQAVLHAVLKVAEQVGFEGQVYSFEIWNPVNLRKRDTAKLYVDVSTTFHLKIRALKEFKSQIGSLIPLIPVVYLRALFAGLQARCRYAEVFYKVR